MLKTLYVNHLQLAKVSVILLALFNLSACTFTIYDDIEKVNVNNKTLSVVFGYYDMKEAAMGGIDWIGIQQHKPKKVYYRMEANDGFFYHLGIPNKTSIQVKEMWRDPTFLSKKYITYKVGGQGRNKTARVIKKPGVYFLGAYKYKNIDSGSIFKKDSFDIIRIKKPSEKALLKRLLAEVKKNSPEYIYQIKMIENRLRKLK